MPVRTRTQNAALNVTVSTIMQTLNIVLGFIARTVFIKYLNSEYLGVNGLFSNILTVLSFAELGIGSAIVFSLYKPIANKDTVKIKALMNFYRTAYRTIGLFVFVVGLAVIPFLKYLINGTPNIEENIGFIYFLFLCDTTLSYLFGYKKTLITAYQKDYIVQIYSRIFQLIKIVIETIFLIITRNYIVYLSIQILSNVALNVALSYKANKLFSYLNDKDRPKLDKDESKSIFDNVKALFIYKFGSVVLNGTDNIIISAIFGVSAVGITSNYSMLMNNVTNIVGQAINSLTASIGNLSVAGSKNQIKDILHELLLICVWLYGFITIGFSVLANDFVYLWLGKSYVLDQGVVVGLLFSLYINGIQYAAYTFRTTQGLFKQSKWVPFITAVLNVILSIWWGRTLGLAGIFFATGVSRLLTVSIIDPWLVYKFNFDEKPFEYYIKYMLESFAVLFNCLINIWLIPRICIDGWLGFFLKFICVCVLSNLIFFLEFYWTPEFKALKSRILSGILKKN